jgi:hypothetical protein
VVYGGRSGVKVDPSIVESGRDNCRVGNFNTPDSRNPQFMAVIAAIPEPQSVVVDFLTDVSERVEKVWSEEAEEWLRARCNHEFPGDEQYL